MKRPTALACCSKVKLVLPSRCIYDAPARFRLRSSIVGPQRSALALHKGKGRGRPAAVGHSDRRAGHRPRRWLRHVTVAWPWSLPSRLSSSARRRPFFARNGLACLLAPRLTAYGGMLAWRRVACTCSAVWGPEEGKGGSCAPGHDDTMPRHDSL